MTSEEKMHSKSQNNNESCKTDKENLYYAGVKITQIINNKNQKIYKDISIMSEARFKKNNQESGVYHLQIPKNAYFLNVTFNDSVPCIANTLEITKESLIEKINKEEKIEDFSFYYDEDCEFHNSELLEKFFKLNGIQIERQKSNFLLSSIESGQENNIKI